eukprot:m.36396 g.36396  ORF g.36396 m.36396 type:complete len:326 (+) comp11013_c0_seq2:207-1184(+)
MATHRRAAAVAAQRATSAAVAEDNAARTGYDSAEDNDYKPNNDDAGSDSDPETRELAGDHTNRKRRRVDRGQRQRSGTAGRLGGIQLAPGDNDAAVVQATTVVQDTRTPEELKAEQEAADAKRQAELDALMAAELGVSVKAKPSTNSAAAPAATAKPTAPKSMAALMQAVNKPKKKQKAMAFRLPSSSSATKKSTQSTAPSTTASGGVTINKTYDFAGESITVSQTVDKDSKAAQAYERQQLKLKEPKSALDNLLGSIGKKKAMTTLTKSKLDWEEYKSTQQGLTDELEQHKKDGFLDKQDFLHRAELREHEREVEARHALREAK